MNIAVVGADGRTGKVFVGAALAAGHNVRAGVYRSNIFGDNRSLSVEKCDANDLADVTKLISGQDVVVSLIGHIKGSVADVQTVAIKNIIAAMKVQKISRLISLTGTGVRFPGDKITLIDRFLNLGVSIVDPDRVSDGKFHVDEIKKSNLDWTIVRVLKLQNVAPKPFSLLESGPTKVVVGRQEVARAILQTIEEASFIRRAPIISRKIDS